MKRFRNAAVVFTIALLATVFVASDASAIPAFARKYQFSCSTCHAPFPRLKPYGEEFAARGFRMEDPSQEPTRATYDVGDPLLKLWREVPLAIRLEGFGSWTEDAEAETSFDTPWVFKILSGGQLSDRVSYYFYFIVEKNETESLEDAYIQYNNLFGSGFDVLFGQFQVSDPLFKRELRLERTDYMIYGTRVGDVQANLTYDRGLVFVGAPGGVDVVFEVVNGNGIPKGEFDSDNNKNVALRLAKRFGKARLGLFGYQGKELGPGGASDTIKYWGPDLAFEVGDRWAVNAQYLRRTDDDPYFTGLAAPDVVTDGGFAEILYFPKGQDGRWVFSALYNRIRSDDPGAEAEVASFTMNYLVARNIRALFEIAHDLDADRNQASFGLITAF